MFVKFCCKEIIAQDWTVGPGHATTVTFVRHVCFMTLMGEMGTLCQISEDRTRYQHDGFPKNLILLGEKL